MPGCARSRVALDRIRAREQGLRRRRIRRELAGRDRTERLDQELAAARCARDRFGLDQRGHRELGLGGRELRGPEHDADRSLGGELRHDRRQPRHDRGSLGLREQRLAELGPPGRIGRRGRRRPDLLERVERTGRIARPAQHDSEPHGPPPPRRLELARGLERAPRLGQVAARGEGLTDKCVTCRARLAVEEPAPEHERAGWIAERERALAVDQPDLRMLRRDRGELLEQRPRLAAVDRRGRPRDAHLRAQVATRPLLGERLAKQLACGRRLPRAQVRVGEVDAVARVLLRERARAMREVRLVRGDRFGPLAEAVEVMTEQDLRVVARRVLVGDREQHRDARRDIARQHELRAECRHHLLVTRRQPLGLAHQRDPLVVLLARRMDGGAQHIRLDATRVERDRLVERLRRIVERPGPERRAAFIDQGGALVVALPRWLGTGRPGEHEDREGSAQQAISTNSRA